MVKKTVSAWKQKKLYTIVAPENFDSQELGYTITADPEKMTGRTVKVSLDELTGDRAKQYIILVFSLVDVKGDKVYTKFKKFYMSEGYLKSKVRKGSTKIDYMTDFTFGGMNARLKMMLLSRHRITSPQRKQILSEVSNILERHKANNFDQFLQAIVFGKFGTEVYKRVKAICPVNRVDVYQLEIKG